VVISKKYGSWRSALRIFAQIGLVATLVEIILLVSVSEVDKPNTRDTVARTDSEPEQRLKRTRINVFNASFCMFLAFTMTWASVFRNISYITPIFLVSVGYSEYEAGLLLSVITGAGALGQILGGIIADRTPRKSYILFGSSAQSSPLILLMAFGTKSDWMILLLALVGFTYFLAIPAWFVLPSKLTSKKSHALAYGLSQSVLSGFGAIDNVIFGFIGQKINLQSSIIFIAILGVVSSLIALKI